MKYRALLLLTVSAIVASPTNPTAPQLVPSATRPTPTGSVIAVHSGNDLQAIYDAAACGSDLVLDAGATFTGNYVFNKQCTNPNWILVEGAGCNTGAVVIPTSYLTQSTINAATLIAAPALTNYATIRSTNSTAPIFTSNGSSVPAKYNYFGCLEVTATVSQGALISATNSLAETLASQLADHLMFDRLYVHGVAASGSVQMTRGLLVAGGYVSIVNSYVSQIYSGTDSQAILLAFGPGPYLIQNNFLSASTEIVMAGGTGKTPGYSCTVAASPAPTTTTATVNSCIDAASGSVSTPVVGTNVMFLTSGSAPTYVAKNLTAITANSSGALTFTAIPLAPVTGAAKVLWGMVPSDITVTKNYFYKLPSWNPSDPTYDGVTRSSKNFMESKYGARWSITANAFINSWDNGQADAFNFNSNDQNGDCPWCVSSDITLSNNVIKNIAGDFGIIASQDYSGNCPGSLARVLISNNLFWVPGGSSYIASGGKVFTLAGNSGTCETPGGGADSVQILHNTMLGAGINMKMASGLPYNFTNLLIRDNITEFDQYRWTNQCGEGSPPNVDGTVCMLGDVSTSGAYAASNNAIINSGAINGDQGISDATITSRYGSMVLHTYYDTAVGSNYSGAPFLNYAGIGTDYHNWALTGAGGWRNAASDSTDPGVNFTTLDSALYGATTAKISGTGKSRVSGRTLVH